MGTGLLQGPRRKQFLTSQVPLYIAVLRSRTSVMLEKKCCIKPLLSIQDKMGHPAEYAERIKPHFWGLPVASFSMTPAQCMYRAILADHVHVLKVL